MGTLKTAGEIEANSNTICHNNAKNWKRQFNDQIPIVRFHLATTEKILGSFTSYVATIDLNNLIQWF